MSKNRKRATTLAAAGAVVAIAIGGGVAWAAFARSANTGDGVSGSSARFDQLGVVGAFADGEGKNMLPGDAAKVKLTITVPSTNSVNARVVSIKPQSLSGTNIGGGVADADKGTCAGLITLKTYDATGIVLAPTPDSNSPATVTVTLTEAVKFASTMDQRCANMTFSPKWDVAFEATRDPAHPKSTTAGVTLPPTAVKAADVANADQKAGASN
jgi:hypothetical protein